VTPEIKAAMEKAVQSREKAGAKLKPGWLAGLKIEELYENYMFHLDAFLFSSEPAADQEAARKAAAESGTPLPGLASFADWQKQNFRRLGYRARWQAYFDEVDVFLSPVAFTTAFPHDHSEPLSKRTIATTQGSRPYMDPDPLGLRPRL
jgi:amidase